MWPWFGWNPWIGLSYWYAYPYGYGMPYGYGYPWGAIPKEEEIRMLEDQARVMESDLNAIRKRLEELRAK